MANEVLIKTGTAFVFADTTDYSSTVSGLTRTEQIDLTGVVAGEARESTQDDFGATRSKQYQVFVGIEFETDPADDEVVEFWLSSSPSATAANANPGGASGTDGDYAGSAGSDVDESIIQLQFIGALPCTNDSTTIVQYGMVGVVTDIARYNSVVVYNRTSDAFHTNAVEMYIAFIPITDEVQ